MSFKKEVLSTLEALNGNISATAKAHKLNRSHVQRWRAQAQEILEACQGKRRQTDEEGQGQVSCRKRRRFRSQQAHFPELEKELVEYIKELRSKGISVHRNALAEKARSLSEDPDFKASDGWLTRFMRRNNLVRRKVTRYVLHVNGHMVSALIFFISYSVLLSDIHLLFLFFFQCIIK